MMDDKSKEMLNEILSKEPAALTDSDKDFLRARRSYLSGEQQAVYAEVLEQPKSETKKSDSEQAQEVQESKVKKNSEKKVRGSKN